MAEPLPVTASQTIGPFYGYALPFTGGADLVPAGHPDAVVVHGYVIDGAGAPIPDAMLEFWQAAPDGSLDGAPGSLRRDQTTGAVLGRDHTRFTGFARVCTDADGHYAMRTLTPAALGACAPYLSVCVFARGLVHHLFTRVYFADQPAANATDPLLSALDEPRRATLVARLERAATHRFDVRIQGGNGGVRAAGDAGAVETVFLDFSGS
ncbi:MAG: protocatechuate 3,4-dioxygenase subunit alpha [Actinocrinis sp.]